MVTLPSHGPASSVDEFLVAPHIVKGYRHVSNKWDCVLSSLTLSNEFVNIWSHGIPAVYYIYLITTLLYDVWQLDSAEEYVPLIVQQCGCLGVLLVSTIAHTLHSESRWHHMAWFMVDYQGISFYSLTSSIAQYAYSRPLDENSGAILSLFSTNAYLTSAVVVNTCVLTSQCYFQGSSRLHDVARLTAHAASVTTNFLPILSAVATTQNW
eukprot:scpid94009/ scgid35624/ Membrane progestin receptor gamma-B; Progestin and adipoQ receptor family member V-B